MEFFDPDVIQKQKRIATSRDDVIHAHRDEIFPGFGFHSVLQKQLNLGSHSVASRDDHRLAILTQVKGRRKKAEGIVQLALFLRPGNVRFNLVDQCRSGPGINSSFLVGDLVRHRLRTGFNPPPSPVTPFSF